MVSFFPVGRTQLSQLLCLLSPCWFCPALFHQPASRRVPPSPPLSPSCFCFCQLVYQPCLWWPLYLCSSAHQNQSIRLTLEYLVGLKPCGWRIPCLHLLLLRPTLVYQPIGFTLVTGSLISTVACQPTALSGFLVQIQICLGQSSTCLHFRTPLQLCLIIPFLCLLWAPLFRHLGHSNCPTELHVSLLSAQQYRWFTCCQLCWGWGIPCFFLQVPRHRFYLSLLTYWLHLHPLSTT